MSVTKRVQQWATFARTWHIYDCTWQNPIDSAKVIKNYLMGLQKPIYHPMNDCGDHVILLNTNEIALPGDEWIKRVYFHHTGYPGGASWTLAWQMHEKDPTMVMKKAVYNAMKGNLQRRYTMQRLHLFPDDKVPDEMLANVTNQIRQLRNVPQRLDHIDKDVLENFPSIMDYPKDYILRSEVQLPINTKELCKEKSKNRSKMVRLGKIDPSSYSEAEKITTKHSDLDWYVDFESNKIKGSVTHTFNVIEKNLPSILLDVRDITVLNVVALASEEIPLNFFTSDPVEEIGAKLTIELPEGTSSNADLKIRIDYETSNNASGLQWLTPEQTLGKNHPYMFSQCQAIHARSVVPCQDTPSVKFSYKAKVEHPKELTSLMSAVIVNSSEGITTFEQKRPIPAYLLAIAIGRLVSKPLGPISNVWAEAGIIDECAEEFSETSIFLEKAESICGPYVWGRYDLLVMPPSFPYGGMENPCLTFVTPTLLAGDKSLADVVAHEIAHSWTGNLVTNKNFEHFWLNEGFTVFVEAKIVGRLSGPEAQDFHYIRNLTDLADCVRTLSKTPELTKLVVDLTNCGPDDAFSSVPYIKGSTFLRYLEDLVGGPEIFEEFLKLYLKEYAYQSITTQDFKSYFYNYFSKTCRKDKLNDIDWDKWLHEEGMPPIIPKYDDSLSKVCTDLANIWGTKSVEEIKLLPDIDHKISTHQIIDFLGKLVEMDHIVDLTTEKLHLLEKTYNINGTKNAEIRFRFLRLCIRARIMDRIDEILEFANSNFRMKFVRPIYRDLAGWPSAKGIAISNFDKVKNQMMKMCRQLIAKDLLETK